MPTLSEATRLREAEREEFVRAMSDEDWAHGLEIVHTIGHRTESLVVRLAERQDATRVEVAKVGERMGDVHELLGRLLERRATMSSASNLDAQALGATIEAVERQATATALACAAQLGKDRAAAQAEAAELRAKVEATAAEFRADIARLDTELGEAPDPTRDVKGHGMRAIVAKLEMRRTAALLVLAGLAGGGGVEGIKAIAKLVHALF